MDNGKPHPTLEEWIELKEDVKHIALTLEAMADELKSNYGARITILESWMHNQKGAENAQKFWIPMFVSGLIAGAVTLLSKLLK